MQYFKKFKGVSTNITTIASISDVIFTYVGACIAIAIIGYLTKSLDTLLIMGSFGASCVLLFAFPSSPFSQPRNVILGHCLSGLIGLIFLHFLGAHWWSMAMALSTAIVVMLLTKTVHPPAGSNPIIVFLLHANFEYLLFPMLSGTIILVTVAVFYINLHPYKTYPQYWI